MIPGAERTASTSTALVSAVVAALVVAAVAPVGGAAIEGPSGDRSAAASGANAANQSGTLLVIDGSRVRGSEAYVIEFTGDVEKRWHGGASINEEDAVEDGAIAGRVVEGRDAYRFHGEVTGIVVHGPAAVTWDGERVAPGEIAPRPSAPNVLFISGRQRDGRATYSFAATGDVHRSRYRQASINRDTSTADTVSDGRVNGTVAGGADAYRFGGRLTEFRLDGPADVRLNGRPVDPGRLGGPPPANETIDSCGLIDSPGRYTLTQNVTDSGADVCVKISASDVVLDGAGHRIDGVGDADSVGVGIDDSEGRVRNVTIRDVAVTDWSTGVRVGRGGAGVSAVRVANVTARGNGVGVDLQRVGTAEVVGSVVRGTGGTGVRANEFDVLTLRGNRIVGSGGFGATAFFGRNATLVNNTVVENGGGGDGFAAPGLLVEDVGHATVRNNTVARNAGAGVELSMVYGGTVAANTVDGNGGDGITASDVSDVAVVDNRVRRNDGAGISLWTATDMTVVGNLLVSNGGEAIRLESVENSTVRNNTVRGGSG